MFELDTPFAKYEFIRISESNITKNIAETQGFIMRDFENVVDLDYKDFLDIIFERTFAVFIYVHKATLNMNDTIGADFIIHTMQLEFQAHRNIIAKEYPLIIEDDIELIPEVIYKGNIYYDKISLINKIHTSLCDLLC